LFLQSGHKTKEDRTLLRALGGLSTNQSYNIGGNLKYYPSILHEMVKACFICGAKDVRLFEIRSNMKQRQKWFEAFETFCGKQIYGGNDKHNLLICICNLKTTKITDYSEICEQHFQQVSIITLQPPKDDAYVKILFLVLLFL
jgi:hypothetical protein